MLKSPSESQAFVDYLYARVVGAIEQWDMATARDTYALWLILTPQDGVVEIRSLDYATRAELTDEDRATWNPDHRTGGLALGLCRAAPGPFDDPEESADLDGLARWDAYWATHPRRFDDTPAQRRALFAHASLQRHRNANPDQFTPQHAAYRDRLAAILTVTPHEQAELEEDDRYLVNRYRQERLDAMLAACTQVIQRLHTEGILERQCGQPVPVGIAFDEDDDPGWAREATRRANPPGLATGLEQWMQGRTDQQREAERSLFEEIEILPLENQAAFWARSMGEIIAAGDGAGGSTLSPRVDAMGLSAEALAARVVHTPAQCDALARHLVLLVESLIKSDQSPLQGLATEKTCRHLLSLLQNLAHSPRRRQAIREDVVERLYHLWTERGGQTAPLNETSLTTLLARTLHSLRPERFPLENPEIVNRLLILPAQDALGESATD